ncbi:MAG: hypothetical protein M3Y81_22105 [Chloroflexota bacterium]|nr:hypothetical protein [Chloroflexota bacterium]
MEKFPQGSEQYEQERPRLDIDLSGPDGNVFMVMGMARRTLDGDTLKAFNQAIWEATQVGSGKTYNDILALVNSYTDLLDTSNSYPQYGPEAHITAAIDRLNGRMQTLPHDICEIGGIYPEFDNPDLGPDKYGMLLTEEIERVEYELGRCSEEEQDGLLELRAHLMACTASLWRAGVRW